MANRLGADARLAADARLTQMEEMEARAALRRLHDEAGPTLLVQGRSMRSSCARSTAPASCPPATEHHGPEQALSGWRDLSTPPSAGCSTRSSAGTGSQLRRVSGVAAPAPAMMSREMSTEHISGFLEANRNRRIWPLEVVTPTQGLHPREGLGIPRKWITRRSEDEFSGKRGFMEGSAAARRLIWQECPSM